MTSIPLEDLMTVAIDEAESSLRKGNSGPIIWGIGDMVMSNNVIDRVSYVAEAIESNKLT